MEVSIQICDNPVLLRVYSIMFIHFEVYCVFESTCIHLIKLYKIYEYLLCFPDTSLLKKLSILHLTKIAPLPVFPEIMQSSIHMKN